MNKRGNILRAILRLDDKTFVKDVQRQKGKLAGLASFAKRALAPLAAAAAGLGTAVGVRRTLDQVDAQAKLARSLGTSVESIQNLSRAAELAGVGQSNLEQGSKDLFRRLSQAASAGGPAAAALDRLGLSAEGLLALPLDARISSINAALVEHVPAAERAAVAGALFGEEGAIAMTRLDPATIAQATEEMNKYGRAISQIEAAKIEEANDAISRIGLTGRALMTEVTIVLASFLTRTADAFAAVGRGVRDVFRFFMDVRFLLRSSYAALGEFVGATTGATDAIKRMWTQFTGAFRAVGGFVRGLRTLAEQSGDIGVVWEHLRAIGREMAERVGQAFSGLGLRFRSVFVRMASDAAERFADIIARGRDWAARMADIGIGAKDAMVAAFGALPDALGDLMFRGAATAVQGVETLVNGVIDRVNQFLTLVNGAIAKLPDWARGDFQGIAPLDQVSLDGPTNPFVNAPSVATAARDAFLDQQGESDFGPGGAGLRRTAAELRDRAANLLGRSNGQFINAGAPLASVGALTTAMEAAQAKADEAEASNTALAESLDDVAASGADAAEALAGGGGGPSSASTVEGAIDATISRADTLRDRLNGIARSFVQGRMQGKSWGALISDTFRQIAAEFAAQKLAGIFQMVAGVAGGGTGNALGRLLGAIIPGRASGGGVTGGQIYQINENTPKSEWMFASASGGVLNHGQMQQAVRSAQASQGTGGVAEIVMHVPAGFTAEQLGEIEGVSVRVVEAHAPDIARAGSAGALRALRQSRRPANL